MLCRASVVASGLLTAPVVLLLLQLLSLFDILASTLNLAALCRNESVDYGGKSLPAATVTHRAPGSATVGSCSCAVGVSFQPRNVTNQGTVKYKRQLYRGRGTVHLSPHPRADFTSSVPSHNFAIVFIMMFFSNKLHARDQSNIKKLQKSAE